MSPHQSPQVKSSSSSASSPFASAVGVPVASPPPASLSLMNERRPNGAAAISPPVTPQKNHQHAGMPPLHPLSPTKVAGTLQQMLAAVAGSPARSGGGECSVGAHRRGMNGSATTTNNATEPTPPPSNCASTVSMASLNNNDSSDRLAAAMDGMVSSGHSNNNRTLAGSESSETSSSESSSTDEDGWESGEWRGALCD